MLGGGADNQAGGVAIRGSGERRRYPRSMRRSCARPGCGEPATVTLSYDYGGATVWLESLAPEGHPMTHDLCERHAARTNPPRGWNLVDRRALGGPLLFEAPLAS